MDTIVIEGGRGQKVVTKDSAFVVVGGTVRFINGGPDEVRVYFPVSVTEQGSTVVVPEWASVDIQVAAAAGEYAYYVYEDFDESRLYGRRTRSAELLHSQPRIVIVASSKEARE
jgi:hypothetical protein